MAAATERDPQLITLYSQADIARTVRHMGRTIVGHYGDAQPVFVGLAKGAVPFTVDLMRSIAADYPHIQPDPHFLNVRTYKADGKPSKPVILKDPLLETKVAGESVLLLDDCLDTGETVGAVGDYLQGHGALAVDLAVVVEKVKPRRHFPRATFAGFILSQDHWIMGYGMDTEGAHRYLPEIVYKSTETAP